MARPAKIEPTTQSASVSRASSPLVSPTGRPKRTLSASVADAANRSKRGKRSTKTTFSSLDDDTAPASMLTMMPPQPPVSASTTTTTTADGAARAALFDPSVVSSAPSPAQENNTTTTTTTSPPLWPALPDTPSTTTGVARSLLSPFSGSQATDNSTGRTKKNRPRIPRKKAATFDEYAEQGGGHARAPLNHEELSEERKRALDANRVAAQKSRQKQRAKQQQFEARIQDMHRYYTEMLQHRSHLQHELMELNALWQLHKECACGINTEAGADAPS